MAEQVFEDRIEAGRLLGERLRRHELADDALILALPRGGVPVAAEVAALHGLPLDLMLVRKLGVPGQEEVAMGAIASGGSAVYNDALLRQLNITEEMIARVVARERDELARRERVYRGERPLPEIAARDVVLVDDGLATGSTMRAAVAAVRRFAPRRTIVAVPVAPVDSVATLEREADEVVCLRTPAPFLGVGRWYRNFAQTSDDEVRDLLTRAWHPDT